MNAIRLTSKISPSLAKRPVRPVEHKRVALRYFTALAEICNGTARREELEDLCDSINIVEALGTMGKIDRDTIAADIDAAIEGIQVAAKCPDGMMRMGAAATLALRKIVSAHDEAIAKFSQATMFEADMLVTARVIDPTANASNGLIVVNA